jgi:hypothetical protein
MVSMPARVCSVTSASQEPGTPAENSWSRATIPARGMIRKSSKVRARLPWPSSCHQGAWGCSLASPGTGRQVSDAGSQPLFLPSFAYRSSRGPGMRRGRESAHPRHRARISASAPSLARVRAATRSSSSGSMPASAAKKPQPPSRDRISASTQAGDKGHCLGIPARGGIESHAGHPLQQATVRLGGDQRCAPFLPAISAGRRSGATERQSLDSRLPGMCHSACFRNCPV